MAIDYKPRLKKKGRVKLKQRLKLVEKDWPKDYDVTGHDLWIPGITIKRYDVRFQWTNGKKENVTAVPPITVLVGTAKDFNEGLGTRGERKLIESASLKWNQKVAFIDEFFHEPVLPKKMMGLGVGSGAMDLLLKKLHKENVRLVVINPTLRSNQIIKDRGFSQTPGDFRYRILNHKGLLEQIKRIEEED
ncbi:MAG: hypothetical protein KAW41_01300 [Candidatus Diapherotrites archaeon]|nr:hypothetical protein [Candidatus Diapherotrites archaeon]